ncbi:hypothetical protein Acr_01g0005660 [Actinidia rufa]|uniref:Protein FAR1-RELATED SEQUENCE n=1 Tax=Actinidia rufa TaxID=165716 RepID=A0A7J0E519_9ERIC|nr:hypothetical protein Acr_01g0005660 [Actinidia rufa]
MATAMVLEPPWILLDPPASYDTTPSNENDLYSRLKSIQRQIEFIEIQEEYVKDELLVIGQFMIVDANSSHLSEVQKTTIGSVTFRSEETTKISGFLTPLRSYYDVKIRYSPITPSSVSLLPRREPEREEANQKETPNSQASSSVATTLGMAPAVGAQLSRVWWICLATPSHSRAGKARVKTSNPVKPRPQSRMNCPAHIRVVNRDGKFNLNRVVLDHNHEQSPGKAMYFKSNRVLDEHGQLRNVFWADARSRAVCKKFGDVVTFDITYLVNKHDMPFAPFEEESQDKYDMVMTRVRELKQELMEASVVAGSNVVSLGDGTSIQEKDSFSLGDGVIPSKRSTNILDLEVAMVVSLVVVAMVVLEELW